MTSPATPSPRGAWWRDRELWIPAAAASAFAIHAACYLYFFVDDEAIPFVYARNLLEGRGLIYTPLEGRVEGYSDFLHVLWSAAILALSRLLRIDAIESLVIASAVNFALGIGVLLLTSRMLFRSGVPSSASAGALGFLALAGPLAVWSCSSLETVPFAFALTVLAALVLPGLETRQRCLPALAAAVVILGRIDGFLYVGAMLAGAFAVASSPRRREIVRTVVLPAAAVAAVYHAGRYAYYGSILSSPLQAKVLYKLSRGSHVIVKAPEHTYLFGFVKVYGAAVLPAVLIAVGSARRSAVARAALIAAAVMVAYVQIVGDWMFGWRFLVPILPLLAVIVATAIAQVPSRARWAAAVFVIVASVAGARTFALNYVQSERRPIWWAGMHLGHSVWLAPYDDLISIARRTVARGDVIAYNQAGLVPFVLDADNIDDLGICSKFEAALPTTDVFFTEVGRYSPLTDAPVFNASHAYLLYSNVRVLMSRTDLLLKANHNRIPEELLDGYFRLAEIDKSAANALYVRTERDASAYRRDPSLFDQNLAHTSRLRRVDMNGQHVADPQIGPSLPFLRWETGAIDVAGDTRISIRFADRDEDVHALYVEGLWARGPVAVTFNLFDKAGRLVASEDAEAGARPASLLRRYPDGLRAHLLVIEARAAATPARLWIRDLRVQGQSAALRDYVKANLHFAGK